MLLQIFIAIISLTFLWLGADFLVNNASKFASALAISPALIGINIGLLTSLPELIVSILALDKNPDIVVGNVIGSNITNLALIMGLCAFLKPIFFSRSSFWLSIFIIFISFLVVLLSYIGNSLNFLDSCFLLILLLLFLYSLYRGFIKNGEKNEGKKESGAIKHLLLAILGTIVLIVSAKYVISSSVYIATELGVSAFFISLSLIAIGTSLPELVTSIIALKNGDNEICIGNVLGSNIYNLLFVFGFSGIIRSIPVASSYIIREFMWMCLISVICGIFFFISRHKQKLTSFARNYTFSFICNFYLFYYFQQVHRE